MMMTRKEIGTTQLYLRLTPGQREKKEREREYKMVARRQWAWHLIKNGRLT
jgi:hypothetical protein